MSIVVIKGHVWPGGWVRHAGLVSLPLLVLCLLGQEDGCEGSGEDSPTPAVEQLEPFYDGCGHRLVVGVNPFVMRLETDEGVLLSRSTRGGVRIGAVPALDSGYNYDPYYFYQHLFPEASDGPDGLEWLTVSEVLDSSRASGELALQVGLSNGAIATMGVRAMCPTAFRVDVAAPGTPTAYIGLDFESPESERYYGLGGVLDSVEHRGQLKAMQFEVAPESEHGYNEAHVPVPLLISTGGWGLFMEDHHPGIFDVANTVSDQVRVEFGTEGLRWYWMAAEQPLTLVQTYTGLTAPPEIPPVWAFAPIQWRDEVSGQEMVLEDAHAIREQGIPGGGIWVDRPYATYVTSMDFNENYSDPDGMVDELHGLGFQLAGWCAPYLNEADPDFPMVADAGWLVGGYTGATSDFGWMVDFSNPDASAWWQGEVSAAIDRGFMGWKLDWGEDILSGIGAEATNLSFYNGEDGSTMHHQYSDYYHQAFREPYQPDDVFIISRTGTFGGQQYTSVIWPGDLCNNFSQWAEDQHVGGLPAAMIYGMSLSASGYPFFASDTGGYNHGRASSEVLVRWAQYSALLPVMQYGGCGGETTTCNPWDMSDEGQDSYSEETLAIFRDFARLHTELFPFFYRLAERARDTYMPVVVPFGLYWPEDGRHPPDQMVVGDALLVAPMVTGGTSRQVDLPEGRFIDFWTGAELIGPTRITVESPLERSPMYFLEGALVPMLRPGVDTLGPAQEVGVDSWEAEAGRVWGYVVPSVAQVDFELPFEGGALGSRQEGSQITVTFEPSASGTRFEGVNLRVFAVNAAGASLDGVPLTEVSLGDTATCDACWARDSGSPWLWIGVNNLDGWRVEIQ